jgi:hypothetical protein
MAFDRRETGIKVSIRFSKIKSNKNPKVSDLLVVSLLWLYLFARTAIRLCQIQFIRFHINCCLSIAHIISFASNKNTN